MYLSDVLFIFHQSVTRHQQSFQSASRKSFKKTQRSHFCKKRWLSLKGMEWLLNSSPSTARQKLLRLLRTQRRCIQSSARWSKQVQPYYNRYNRTILRYSAAHCYGLPFIPCQSLAIANSFATLSATIPDSKTQLACYCAHSNVWGWRWFKPDGVGGFMKFMSPAMAASGHERELVYLSFEIICSHGVMYHVVPTPTDNW